MPVTKSAIKKLRQDKKKTAVNKKILQQVDSAVKGIKKTKKVTINEAYSKIDKAAKKGLIHLNKAARLKSQLSKIAPKKVGTKTGAKKTRPAVKKASPVKKSPSTKKSSTSKPKKALK